MIDSVAGIMKAAPTPCAARKPTSTASFGANPIAALARPNTITPNRKIWPVGDVLNRGRQDIMPITDSVPTNGIHRKKGRPMANAQLRKVPISSWAFSGDGHSLSHEDRLNYVQHRLPGAIQGVVAR